MTKQCEWSNETSGAFFVIRSSSFDGTSQNQHAIAVTEKPIPLSHGFLIRAQNKFTTGKSTHQHKQSRARQMKIGKQNVDHTKLVRRVNKDVGLALGRLNSSEIPLN